MTIKASTGLRNKLLDSSPLRTIFNLGFLKLYNGATPASADDAAVGAPVLIVSNNATGTGITFETSAAAGAISKKLTETWSGVASATLTVTHFRLCAAGDDGLASTTQARLQGSVALAGADLNMTVVNLVNTTTYPIDTFAVSLPTF